MLWVMMFLGKALAQIGNDAHRIDTRGLPKDAALYVEQRSECNKARNAILEPTRIQKYQREKFKIQVLKFCSGVEVKGKALLQKYQKNNEVLVKLYSLGVADAPFKYGNTIDALMPDDIILFYPQALACSHFAGEFSGDRSGHDAYVSRQMKSLKCYEVEDKIVRLKKKYHDTPDVILFLDQALAF